MSGNSNFDYGNSNPYNTSSYVNGTSSTYSGNFSSNEIPGNQFGLSGAKSNIDAAAGYVPGICMKGGAKHLKTKIKNITKYYKKMKTGGRKIKSIKKRLMRFHSSTKNRTKHRRSHHSKHHKNKKRHTKRYRRHKQRGGYAQYQNNLPLTHTYEVGNVSLPPSELGLANPPPIRVLPNCTNCVDNYNHFTNKGFPSQGH